MNVQLLDRSLDKCFSENADALVVMYGLEFKPGKDPLSLLVQDAIRKGDFEVKPGKVLQLYGVPGIKARRVVLCSAMTLHRSDLTPAVSGVWAVLREAKVQRMVWHAVDGWDESALYTVATLVAEQSYVYTTTLSTPKARSLQNLSLSMQGGNPSHKEAVARAQACIAGIELAKEWANRPSNYATPTLLAGVAQKLAKHKNIQCEVLGPKEVARLKMGAFLSVAKGAVEPLRFIVLRYNGGPAKQAPVVLIGKGITFDTGGISLKPGAEMDEMKYDMGGAASVLGTFEALARLQPRINVVGLIPATENMPDGQATKPGDVVTSMSGQTIEILNTDAEGRLVLCDAMTYAERFKPRAVVDIATLTGACVIALGHVRSGLYANDEPLGKALMDAGESCGDLCWRMPLDDAYAEGLKTKFADVANVAGRPGGSITAAKFLQRFGREYAWAHLDIAGTAWRSGAAKGATGRPVGLLLHYLLQEQLPDLPAPHKRSSRSRA
ncbi:MAG: Cytosol aminopeptidase [Pseudomonadota bacterium]|jgi:leucyl aminopeptidase